MGICTTIARRRSTTDLASLAKCSRAKGGEFPSPEDRTYCIKVLENYDTPSYDARRVSIKVWRDGLSHGERARLNHPKRVWTSYWDATEPKAERDAKRTERAMKETKKNPLADLVADTERDRDDARRHTEGLRELLGRVLNECEDIPPELREAIERKLAE